MTIKIGRIGQKVHIDTKVQEYNGEIIGIKIGSMQYDVKIEEVIKGNKEVGTITQFPFKFTEILSEEVLKTRVGNKEIFHWINKRIGNHKIVEYLGYWQKENWKQKKHWFKVLHDNGTETEKTLGTLRKLEKAEKERQRKAEEKKEEEKIKKEQEKVVLKNEENVNNEEVNERKVDKKVKDKTKGQAIHKILMGEHKLTEKEINDLEDYKLKQNEQEQLDIESIDNKIE